jgi:hypothetical protein
MRNAMSKILIGALSAWKYPERRAICRRLWARDAWMLFLMNCQSAVQPERIGDCLVLPGEDRYNMLAPRTIAFCRWALDTADWDYLFKCDDDTDIDIQALESYPTCGQDYIGAEWKPGYGARFGLSNGYASGGAGYFLSRRAAQIIADYKHDPPSRHEDVSSGLILQQSGILLTCDNRSFIPLGQIEGQRPKIGNPHITIHRAPGIWK